MQSSSRPNYKELVEEVKRLDETEQRRFLDELSTIVNGNEDVDKRYSILELRGLGKELWNGIDAQEYVNRERASWSG